MKLSLFLVLFVFMAFPSVSSSHILYRVKKGETLYSISRRFGVTVNEIVKLNHIKDPSHIAAGSILKIPDRKRKRLKSFAWPLKGKVVKEFGYDGKTRNPGIDIEAKPGTPVKASMDGVVIFSGYDKLLGGIVILSHPGEFETVYGFLEKVVVKRGARVRVGTVIGYSGYDPSTLLPRLHFEIRKRGKPVNPLPFLSGHYYGRKSGHN